MNKQGKQGGFRGVGACVHLAQMERLFVTSQRTIKKIKKENVHFNAGFLKGLRV